MAKIYFAKIYKPNGDYIDILRDFNFSGFRKQINGGLGELSLSLAKKFDDFDENYTIKLNNRIDLWCSDGDTGTDGIKIYSGFISKYEPFIDGNNEGVNVKCLGYVSKLATSILKNGTQIELKTDTNSGLTTGDTASGAETRDIVLAIIDRYRAEANNPSINYSATSTEDSGNTFTYTFNGKYYSDAIDKCREASPSNWWWYVGADNILQFKPKPNRSTHTFTFGKHFKSIKVEKNMEGVLNKVLFSSGNNTDEQILNLYEDTDSIDEFDDRWAVVTDNRVSVAETADNMGESTLQENKDEKVKTVIEIIDNNGTENGYDIESINPGDTCKFIGFNDITSQTFIDNMQILGVQYTPDSVVLEIENLNPNIARENWKNRQKIYEQESSSLASSYDTDQASLNGFIGARAYLSDSIFTTVSGVATQLLLDVENYDVGSNFSSYKFTAPVDGYYSVNFSVVFSTITASGKTYQSQLFKNGVGLLYSSNVSAITSGSIWTSNGDIIKLNKGDYLELYYYHNDSTTVDIQGGDTYTFLTVALIKKI